MTTYSITEKYLIARAVGTELGARIANGDTLDFRKCWVITTDFVAGLFEATTDKQMTVLVSSDIQLDLFTMARKAFAWEIRIETIGDALYRYLGDKLTANELRGVEYRAVMRVNGRGATVCTRGKNGSMLMETVDGRRFVAIGRLLRKVKE